jgi:hypothetical protein
VSDDEKTTGDPLGFLKLLPGSESIPVLEKAIDVPPGFLTSMWSEPSDAFLIVKAHAVFESLLNQLIESLLPAMKGFAWRLAMTGRASKPAFVRHIALLEPDELRFAEGLAEIRNRIAHVPRELAEYSLLKAAKTDEKLVSWLVAVSPESSFSKADHANVVRENPRLFFCLNSYFYMWRFSAQKAKARAMQSGRTDELTDELSDVWGPK